MTPLRNLAFFVIAACLVLLPLAAYYSGGIYVLGPAKLVLAAGLALCLTALAGFERSISGRRMGPADALEWLLIAVLLFMALAALNSINPRMAWMGWLQWAGGALTFGFLRRSEDRNMVPLIVMFAGALAIATSGAQAAGYGPLRVPDLNGMPPPTGAFDSAAEASHAALALFAPAAGMVTASQSMAVLAGGMALALAAATYLVIAHDAGTLAAAGLLVIILAALAFAFPRWQKRKHAVLFTALMLLFFAGAAFTAPGAKALSQLRPSTAGLSSQFGVLRDSAPLLLSEGVFGAGPDQFALVFPERWSQDTAKRAAAAGVRTFSTPQNEFLALAMDGGIGAAIAFVFFVYLALITCLRRWRSNPPSAGLMAAGVVVVAFLLAGILGTPLQEPFPMLVFFASLAMLAPLHATDDAGTGKPSKRALVAGLVATGLAVINIPVYLRSLAAEATARKAAQHLAADPARALHLALSAANDDAHNALAFSVAGQAKLARPLDQEHDYQGAENLLQQAMALNPGDYETHYFLGLAAYQRAVEYGEPHDLARQEFARTLAINPYHGKAYFMQAMLNAADFSEWHVVRRDLDRAIKLEPPLILAVSAAKEFDTYRSDTAAWSPWFDPLKARYSPAGKR